MKMSAEEIRALSEALNLKTLLAIGWLWASVPASLLGAYEDGKLDIPMLEKPDLQDERIAACLQDEYGLRVVQVAFLPLGADLNTAVYRVVADDETPYFVKLRRGVFDETSVALPKFLSDQGIGQIIAPSGNQDRATLGKPGRLQDDSLPVCRGPQWL